MGDTVDTPFYEWGAGVGSVADTPFYEWGRGVADQPGYNSDGTYTTPVNGRAVVPVDAGGGPAANYAPQILDVFKFGVGVWNQQEQQKNLLDYKRFEATQLGAYVQGQPALYATNGGRVIGGASGIVLIGAIVVAILLLKDK